MRDDVPSEWRDLFARKGLDSGRDLAKALGVAPETARRLVRGLSVSRATVEKAADYFQVPEATVLALRGDEPAGQPFRLPRQADQLNTKQRRAVLAVIDALLDTHIQPTRHDPTDERIPFSSPEFIAAAKKLGIDTVLDEVTIPTRLRSSPGPTREELDQLLEALRAMPSWQQK